MNHVLDLTVEQLAQELAPLGQKPFHARQIASWIYHRGVYDFSLMTDLSMELRTALREKYQILSAKIVARNDSQDGVTKLLLEWPDGQRIETVLIPSEERTTACVSTQAGCPIGCLFCASGADGVQRNLTGGEIVEQILQLQQAAGKKVSHVVFMGMGEPLANYENTLLAVRAIIDPRRLGISARHVTVSTVGIPKMIRRLAGEELPITLAISLHAPTDALRRQIIPRAPSGIEELIEAGQEFFDSRKRELTLEYVLLEGVNDTNVCAEGLARIAHRLRCNVNLIRYNPVSAAPYARPAQAAVTMFANRLLKRGVNVQIRRSRGIDADAACGQLRKRTSQSQD